MITFQQSPTEHLKISYMIVPAGKVNTDMFKVGDQSFSVYLIKVTITSSFTTFP